jgi:glyoxylase-like metal-dependent hydrolase (beta-lactamase superfamily II)
MKIERVIVGVLETNCYILSIDNKALIIDPGGEYNKIKKSIGTKEVIGVIVTHYHFDHIGALDYFDRSIIYDYSNLKEGINKIGPFTFEIIYTPGHKEDLISIYFEKDKCMFVGDFILNGTIGRTDLTGGSVKDMNNSIKKIKKYPKDTIIYPGHDEKSILEYEINNNIYFS